MPQQVNLALHKFERISQGEATENDLQNILVFKKLLMMLTNPPNCDSEHRVQSKDVLCVQNEENSKLKPTRNIKNNLVYDNKLKNIFDYLAAVIDGSQENMTSEIEKLLKLCSIFLRTDLSQSRLTLEQKNTLNIAYMGLFTRITNFPNLLDIPNEQNTNYLMVDLLNSTNYFLRAWTELNLNTQFSIFEALKNYTESIGNLTRQTVHEDRNISPIEIEMKRLINLLTPYLDADQIKILMFSFAHEYKSGEELSACKEVFNRTDCDPYKVTEEFLKISSASKSYDSKISLEENTDVGIRILKKIKFDTASFKDLEAKIKLNNFSHYFKKLIKETNDKDQTLPDDFTKNLCEFLSYQFEVFKHTDTLLMSYRSSFSLFLAFLKNPSAKNYPLIMHYLIQAFNPMRTLLMKGLGNSSKDKRDGILSTLEIFADMLHLAVNDVTTITLEDKKSINLEISQLLELCFKIDECPTSSAVDQFFNSLGSMVRNLSKKIKGDQEKRQAETIEQTTQQLIENAKNNSISPSRIGNYAFAYLDGRYDQNVKAITRDCKKLFNLEACQPAHFVNRTVENHTDFVIYKTTPAMPAVNTTHLSAINQTSTPVLMDNKTTIALPENVNHTFSNQTVDQTTPSNNSPINVANPGLTLGASAAHGVGSGMLNGLIQYFATKESRQGEPSSRAKALIKYSILLLPAAYAATLPIMLFKIQEHIHQGDEDEAQRLWDVLLKNAFPTFITSVVTNCGYHLALEFTQLISNRLHTLTQNLPLLATAVNLYSNPMETGVHLATSFASSSLTYLGLNRFFPVKIQQSLDIETNTHTKVSYDVQKDEVELLKPLQEKIVSENEVIKKTYQFICLPELEGVKKLSKENLDQLKVLIETLEKDIETLTQQKEITNTSSILNALLKSIKDNTHILNILKVQFQSAEVLYSALSEDIHLEACEMYTLSRKKVFVSSMEKLGNVFKLMETNFKTLQGEIKAAIGYTEASSENFSNEVKNQLTLLSQRIIFPLSKVTLYKDRYSNANAIEKTEDRCKKEANQGLFNVLIQADHTVINRKTSKVISNGNRNTFAFSSGSDGDLRISSASSSTESEHSTISGNSAHNPIDPQQTAPLLNGRH